MKKLLLAVWVLLVASACARAPVSEPSSVLEEPPPLPPLCYACMDDEADDGDGLCFVGLSSELSTPESALQDARRHAIQIAAEELMMLIEGVHFHVEAHRLSPWEEQEQRKLRKQLEEQIAKQVRFAEQVLFTRETPSGTAQMACIKARISHEAIDRITQPYKEKGFPL